MSASGADPDQLDRLAKQFEQLAGELNHRRSTLGFWLEADRFWRGRRADEFRHQWTTEFSVQIGQATEFLQHHVSQLQANANQQRIASGEQPKDHGGGSFMNKLWGAVENTVERAERDVVKTVEDTARTVADGAKTIWDVEVAGFKELGASPVLAEVLKATKIVNDVAGIVSLIPIPGVQEAALALTVVSGAVLLVGQAAQMANTGKWDGLELAEDGVSIVGGSLGLGYKAAVGSADAAKTVGEVADFGSVNVTSPSGLKAAAAAFTQLSTEAKKIDVAVAVNRGAGVLVNGVDNYRQPSHDLAHGDGASLANDGLGAVAVVGGMLGQTGQVVGGFSQLYSDLGLGGDAVRAESGQVQ